MIIFMGQLITLPGNVMGSVVSIAGLLQIFILSNQHLAPAMLHELGVIRGDRMIITTSLLRQ